MIYQRLFDLAFAAGIGGAEEVEKVRVFEYLIGEIGIGGRKGRGEVVDRFARADVGVGRDLQGKDVP